MSNEVESEATELHDSRALRKELERIYESGDVKQLVSQILESLTDRTSGYGAVAWSLGQNGKISEVAHHRPEGSDALQLTCTPEEHFSLLSQAIKQGTYQLASLKSDENGTSNQNTPVLAIAPIKSNDNTVGLFEIFLKPSQSKENYEASMRSIKSVCEDSMEFLEPMISGEDAQGPEIDLDSLNTEVHRSLDFKETSIRIANEAQRQLNCDRVSVCRIDGGKVRVLAVNGQTKVNRRANVVRLMERLVTRIIPTGEEFWYPLKSDDKLAPQIEKTLNVYLNESLARTFILIPITEEPPHEEKEVDELHQNKSYAVIGALVIENFAETLPKRGYKKPIETVSRHAGNALRNSKSHRDLFLYPLWHALGKSKAIVSARNMPKTAAISGAIILALLALWLVPAPFKVSAPGNLVPKDRANVYAKTNGKIVDLRIGHSDNVTPESVLAVMESNELDLQLQKLIGEQKGVETELNTLKRSSAGGGGGSRNRQSDAAEKAREISRRSAGLKRRLASLRKQRTILEQQKADLIVKSPIDGQIMTWNPEDTLMNRPVQMGERLFEVANTSGAWELELKMPDKRIGHLLKRLEDKEQEEKPLVRFMLASNPKKKYEGRVVRYSRGTEIDQENGQYIRVTVEIAAGEIEGLQNRTEVQANIFCGSASLGYVWFHDLIDFARVQVFKYL